MTILTVNSDGEGTTGEVAAVVHSLVFDVVLAFIEMFLHRGRAPRLGDSLEYPSTTETELNEDIISYT